MFRTLLNTSVSFVYVSSSIKRNVGHIDRLNFVCQAGVNLLCRLIYGNPSSLAKGNNTLFASFHPWSTKTTFVKHTWRFLVQFKNCCFLHTSVSIYQPAPNGGQSDITMAAFIDIDEAEAKILSYVIFFIFNN